MTPTLLAQAAWGLAIVMLSARRKSARRRARTPVPEDQKLAGVPLSRLLDDPCGPGAVMRDMLTHHPPSNH